jgi:DNA-binding transcriptional ArsR family regulator
MARAPTTLDPFNAVAEPKRRDLLDLLAKGPELSVGGIVTNLGWPQPQVSKHLRVLLEVGLVKMRTEGRTHLYAINAMELKPIHEWTKTFERFWSDHLQRIKAHAESKVQTGATQPTSHNKGESHG